MKLNRITTQDLTAAIVRLATSLGKPIAERQGTAHGAAISAEYIDALRYMTPSQLRNAVTVAIEHCKYFPSISELKEYGGGYIPDPPDEVSDEELAETGAFISKMREKYGWARKDADK